MMPWNTLSSLSPGTCAPLSGGLAANTFTSTRVAFMACSSFRRCRRGCYGLGLCCRLGLVHALYAGVARLDEQRGFLNLVADQLGIELVVAPVVRVLEVVV